MGANRKRVKKKSNCALLTILVHIGEFYKATTTTTTSRQIQNMIGQRKKNNRAGRTARACWWNFSK